MVNFEKLKYFKWYYAAGFFGVELPQWLVKKNESSNNWFKKQKQKKNIPNLHYRFPKAADVQPESKSVFQTCAKTEWKITNNNQEFQRRIASLRHLTPVQNPS